MITKIKNIKEKNKRNLECQLIMELHLIFIIVVRSI